MTKINKIKNPIAKVLTTGLFKSKVIKDKKKESKLYGKEFTSIILEDPLED